MRLTRSRVAQRGGVGVKKLKGKLESKVKRWRVSKEEGEPRDCYSSNC